jgi:hypothetical protein
MKTALVLDVSTWRCGEDGDKGLGDGGTFLLNQYGFMCCLGQWSAQHGVPEMELLGKYEPGTLNTIVPMFVITNTYEGKITNDLAKDCMSINDCEYTTVDEKINRLTKRLAKENIELVVINNPY